MSHTPGPWRFRHGVERGTNGPVENYGAIEAGVGYFIGNEDGFCATGIMSEANARLIAAAPELLAALQAIMAAEIIYTGAITETMEAANMDSTDHLAKQARAAINKALGK